MKILFIADVVGNIGKWVLSKTVAPLREEHGIDICIANGENLAGGKGLTRNLYGKMRRLGVDVVTTGNHIWDNPDILPALKTEAELLRPFNYPTGNPGHGLAVVALDNGLEVAVLNLQGRTFMPPIDCPFAAAAREVEKLRPRTPFIVVDIHAEATSEKAALGWHLDGKVTAVVGTHTHVQTADERVLPKGTAYITDAGITGAFDSVIGVKKELVVRRFLMQSYVRFEPSSQTPVLNGVIIEADDTTGKALSIQRVFQKVSAEDAPH